MEKTRCLGNSGERKERRSEKGRRNVDTYGKERPRGPGKTGSRLDVQVRVPAVLTVRALRIAYCWQFARGDCPLALDRMSAPRIRGICKTEQVEVSGARGRAMRLFEFSCLMSVWPVQAGQ